MAQSISYINTFLSVVPGIEANNGNAINVNGLAEVGYVVGEKIHVRMTGKLNGQVPNSAYSVTVNDCTINELTGDGTVVQGSSIALITGGDAVNAVVPTGVEMNPGHLNGGSNGNQGAGFWFQVFTYRAGSRLQLFCTANFTPHMGRKRRSADELEEELETETHEIFIKLRVFDPASGIMLKYVIAYDS